MIFGSNTNLFLQILKKDKPIAAASIRGSQDYPNIRGKVDFYKAKKGTLIKAQIFGLPQAAGRCAESFYGFHLHAGSSCTGDKEDPFKNAGTHFNPDNCQHPSHAGDFPPLLGNDGYAYMLFFTNRFAPQEAIGKTVVVHHNADDMKTQPAGNSGMKIACGEVFYR